MGAEISVLLIVKSASDRAFVPIPTLPPNACSVPLALMFPLAVMVFTPKISFPSKSKSCVAV